MTTNRPPSCDLPPGFYQTKLKPCPFCDSHLVEMIHQGHDVGFAYCEVCNAGGPLSDTIDGKSWNAAPRRSEVLELIRLVETTERDLRLSKLYERFKAVVVFADKLRKEMEG